MSDDRIFDLSGRELRKTLKLMAKTNSCLSDWLFSDVIYYADPDFIKDIRDAHNLYYNPLSAVYHFANMAKTIYDIFDISAEIPVKKFLYFLRAVLCVEYILSNESHPPVNFIKMLSCMKIADEFKTQLRDIVDEKSQIGEGCRIRISAELKSFALERFKIMNQNISSYRTIMDKQKPGVRLLDELATKYISRHYAD